MAVSQAIIGDIISPRERGRYQGYMGGVFAVASVAGPLLGGFFTDELSWRWIFLINLPLGALALVVTSTVLKLPAMHVQHKIDYLGSVLMVGGVSCLLLVTTWGGREYAWTSPTIVGLALAAAVQLGLFVWQEFRAEEPLLPPRLFRDAVFRVSTGIGFVLGIAMFGAISFLPVYLQVVKDASATGSGLRMLPMMLGVVTSSILSGRMITQTGRYRVFPIAGTGLVAIAAVLLSRLDVDTPFWLISAYMLLLGLGMGLVMQVIVLTVQNSVDYRDMGAATAGVNFFRSMGGALGVAIFGSVLANRLDYNISRLVPAEALQGVSTGVLTSSPERIRALPPEIHDAVVQAFANSIEVVFLVAVPVALVAFGLSWLLHEKPLREYVGPLPSDMAADEAAGRAPAPAQAQNSAAEPEGVPQA
jgi:EmrB/QacA subfamily drug resistance transporter